LTAAPGLMVSKPFGENIPMSMMSSVTMNDITALAGEARSPTTTAR
jgi:hypothetical protein